MEYGVLLRRARDFIEEARDAMKKGRFDIAVFLGEVAVQLRIKAALLRFTGDYPRTHSIRHLLGRLGGVKGGECESRIRSLISSRRTGIIALEESYIGSRYFGVGFTREDAEELLSVAEELYNIVEECDK